MTEICFECGFPTEEEDALCENCSKRLEREAEESVKQDIDDE